MRIIKHAFLIDDDHVTNMINSRVIQNSKLATKVSVFLSAQEALARLTEMGVTDPAEFPQLIFLDIAMPGMNGWDFLDSFVKLPEPILKKCEVVVLTSSIDLFDIKKAKRYSVVRDYIIKPLNSNMLTMLGSQKHEYFSISQSAMNAI